jgi:hypothetical protein
VHQRSVDLLRLKSPPRDKPIAAIAEGDGDVAALREQAYAEATVVPAINRAVIAGVHNKIVQLYSGHAGANHKKPEDQFNTAAKKFVGTRPQMLGDGEVFGRLRAAAHGGTDEPLGRLRGGPQRR